MTYSALSLKNEFSTILVLIAILAFFLISLKGIVILIREHRPFKNNKIEFLLVTLFSIISTYLILSAITTINSQVEQLIIPYRKGNYQVVTGVVENFSDSGVVKFNVDNVDFEFAPYEVTYLGLKSKNCVKEHDFVTVKYIEKNENNLGIIAYRNVIMELECLE